jgi:exodeoxyribonuclease V alpha subunit
VERFGWTFVSGDKVMQVENGYGKEVYHGDIGFVTDIDIQIGELTTSFDGRTVTYGFGELDVLVSADTATIHESQGSEYPPVIVPVLWVRRSTLRAATLNVCATGFVARRASSWRR